MDLWGNYPMVLLIHRQDADSTYKFKNHSGFVVNISIFPFLENCISYFVSTVYYSHFYFVLNSLS